MALDTYSFLCAPLKELVVFSSAKLYFQRFSPEGILKINLARYTQLQGENFTVFKKKKVFVHFFLYTLIFIGKPGDALSWRRAGRGLAAWGFGQPSGLAQDLSLLLAGVSTLKEAVMQVAVLLAERSGGRV